MSQTSAKAGVALDSARGDLGEGAVKEIVRVGGHTRSEKRWSAPKIHGRWDKQRTASFMILGDSCTRPPPLLRRRHRPPGGELGRQTGAAARGRGHRADGAETRRHRLTMVDRDDLARRPSRCMAATSAWTAPASPPARSKLRFSDSRAPARLSNCSSPSNREPNTETVRGLTTLACSPLELRRFLGFLPRRQGVCNPEGATKVVHHVRAWARRGTRRFKPPRRAGGHRQHHPIPPAYAHQSPRREVSAP